MTLSHDTSSVLVRSRDWRRGYDPCSCLCVLTSRVYGKRKTCKEPKPAAMQALATYLPIHYGDRSFASSPVFMANVVRSAPKMLTVTRRGSSDLFTPT